MAISKNHPIIVFYSWQSDISNNRSFIQDALDQAVAEIANDPQHSVVPIIDRDTKGVPGAPDIAATIYEKIDRCHLFVADITVINSSCTICRPTPNPNVLIELGYALKALSDKRIVMMVNMAYGSIDKLPFDLRTKRVLQYSSQVGDTGRGVERKRLSKILAEAFRSTILEERSLVVAESAASMVDDAIKAITDQIPAKLLQTRNNMKTLTDGIIGAEPDWDTKGEIDELVISGIKAATPFVIDIGRLAEAAAALDDNGIVQEISQGLRPILDRYSLAIPNQGTISRSHHQWQFDYYKFLGQELFTILIGKLLSFSRYSILREVVTNTWLVNNVNCQNQRVHYPYVNAYLYSFDYRNKRSQTNWITPHGQYLTERHSTAPLSEIAPQDEFIEGDMFLFIRSFFQSPNDRWIPRTSIYSISAPAFLGHLVDLRYRTDVLNALGTDIITFKHKWSEMIRQLARYFPEASGDPFHGFDIREIV